MINIKKDITLRNREQRKRDSFSCTLTNIYVVIMFTVFPLFLTNYYQSARRDKFWFFIVVTALFAIPAIFFDLYKNPQNFLSPDLNLTDIGILSFFGVNLISTIFSVILSSNTLDALILGSYGRNMGLLMVSAIVLCYFAVSRYFRNKKYILYLMFVGMSIMSFVAVLNYYYIDVLGIFQHYNNNQTVIKDFTTTIGNKNYLSAMICVALPFSMGVSIVSKDRILRIIGYISTALQFMGLLVATSDGGFLGFFASLAVMLIVASRDLEKLSRYFFSLFIIVSSAKLLWLFDLAMQGNSKGYTSFSQIFIFNLILFALIPIFLGLSALCSVLSKKNKEQKNNIIFISVLSVIALGILGIIFMFIYYSVINTATPTNSFTKFFRFNESWGTHRGFFWIKSFEVFSEFDIVRMLFGSGPDTFYNVFSPYFGELYDKFGDSSSNAAHSVYINYLVTTGILGLVSYLVFIGASIKNAVQKAFKNPLSFICMAVIVAFAVQDAVNIANPVNTPWLILFVAMSESAFE